MFNKDFYPTPKNVITQMLMGVDLQNKIVLEPSAGKGNIVDYLIDYGVKDVLTCEKEADLAKIVSQKSKFLTFDFLKLKSDDISHVDLIVMNPPFSEDAKHILHAWNIAPEGCNIISLCNYETVRKNYTTERQILSEIIDSNGRYDDLGNCFSSAERTTDVRVACVTLFKPKQGNNEFEGYFDYEEEAEATESGLVRYNYVRDIVSRYVDAVSKFDYVSKISNEINEITNTISNDVIRFGAYKRGESNYGNTAITRDYFKKDLQKRCWRKIFDEMKMSKYVTRGVLDNINAFVEKQESVPFTVKNVYNMLNIIAGTHVSRMQQVLIEAFDNICSFSADNSTAGEKWKTNSNYMINRRFIVPYITDHCFYGTKRDFVSISFGRNNKIDDILKALCFLTGKNYDENETLYKFISNNQLNWGEWYKLQPFFRIRGYKKGTMHFEFLDEKVWMKFNTEVAKVRGWNLPKDTNSAKKARKKGVEVELYD